jgi:photosystem II stability/assembly factor-like uncharacterized protein
MAILSIFGRYIIVQTNNLIAMIARLLFILVFIPIIASSQEGNFKWQNPCPQGNDLNGCCCASGHFAWTVGNAGTIMKSSDKGVTWTLQESGVSNQLNGVSFIDSLNGWACGNTVMLHTDNGGGHWEEQTIPFVTVLNDIQFVNPDLGWAVGGPAHILKTTNGGLNWSIMNFNLLKDFTSVHFIDSLRGYVSGTKGAFLKTGDGGESWQVSEFFSEDFWLRSVFFINQDTGYLTGLLYDWVFSDPVVLKTQDGGQTWDTTFLQYRAPYEIFFTDPQHGYTVGSNSSIHHTSDGGETWFGDLWGDYHNLYSLAFFDENYAIGVGREAQIIRKLGGPFYIWKYNETGTTEWIEDITFTSDLNGWAVGLENTILHTTDGGFTWTPVESGFSKYQYWFSVTFADSLQGWISGDLGNIIHTANGGATWQKQTTNTSGYLYSIFFLDENYGWAVGEDDIRLHTADGGQTWQGFPSLMWEFTNDVFFIDYSTGWVVGGYNGFINKTTNGGANWTMQVYDLDVELYSVFFTGPESGWVVGEEGTVMHTMDGGTSWQNITVGVTLDLDDVFFINQEDGWITGDDGTILHTIDGGQTWEIATILTNNYIDAAFFIDENTGWFCGQNGTILNYRTGNPVNIENDLISTVPSALNIFPNPCKRNSVIRISPGDFDLVRIYDLQGRMIKSTRINNEENFQSREILLKLDGIPPGVYLIECMNDKISLAGKIIVY